MIEPRRSTQAGTYDQQDLHRQWLKSKSRSGVGSGGTVHSGSSSCCWSFAPSLQNGPYQSFLHFPIQSLICQYTVFQNTYMHFNCDVNKFAQSNLGRGPRRGAVAHVRRKVPIGYNGAPQIHPQKYPFPDPIRHFSTMHWTLDRPTVRPTDRPRESLTTIGRCATRATRPNNTLRIAKFYIMKKIHSIPLLFPCVFGNIEAGNPLSHKLEAREPPSYITLIPVH